MAEPHRLVLLRHGEAERVAERDDLRVLTPRGRDEAARTGRLLAGLGLDRPVVFSSPYVRARETAFIVAATLGVATPAVIRHFTPDEDPRRAAGALEAAWSRGTPVVVTHMPLIGALIGWLVDGDPALGPGVVTAGGALLEGDWPSCGVLRNVRTLSP